MQKAVPGAHTARSTSDEARPTCRRAPTLRANLSGCAHDAASSTVRGVLHHIGAAAAARGESGDARARSLDAIFARFAKGAAGAAMQKALRFVDAFVGAREASVCAAAITGRARASEQEHGE